MALKTRDWTRAAAELTNAGEPYAIATVVATSGSTPRDGGTKMVIDEAHTYDTIGGGGLEFLVVQRARELLARGDNCQEIKQFPLGAEARQCCGGSVSVLLECFAGSDFRVAVFGAGHVARALMTILGSLSCRVDWIDSRRDLVEDQAFGPGVRSIVAEQPETVIRDLPDDCHVLVLTHDHALDFRLVHCLLDEWRWRSVGLIGSDTKAKRFRRRLQLSGVDDACVNALRCPVGMPSVGGKLPMEVAVSIAAQLLAQHHGERDDTSAALDWRQMKSALKNTSDSEIPS